MTMHKPFKLPNELLISALAAQYPCRESQIRSLATLLSPHLKPPRNLVLYGLEATGKSSITSALLSALSSSGYHTAVSEDQRRYEAVGSLQYAIVKNAECITGRHLLETTVGAVANALGLEDGLSRCENLAQLAVKVGKLSEQYEEGLGVDGCQQRNGSRFVLVFDGIDRQRDAPPSLLPALARMTEIIPNLTTIFIVTSPRSHFLHTHGVPHIHFPAYTKAESLQILSLQTPSITARSTTSLNGEYDEKTQKEWKDLWTRFCSAVWDTLSKHSGRDILSFRTTCILLWPSFTAPIQDGTFTTKDFSRLLVSKRSLFQDERVLIPSIISAPPTIPAQTHNSTSSSNLQQLLSTVHKSTTTKQPDGTGISSQLPYYSRLLLVAAYLASYTPSRHDVLLFSISSSSRRKKRGGGTAKTRLGRPSKHRKISGKLLGPQSFILERMLAIFHVVRIDSGMAGAHGNGSGNDKVDRWTGTADIPMAIATLASLRLVVRTAGGGAGGERGDFLDAGAKWKVNIGWEVIRGVARSVDVDVEEFMVD